MLHRLELAMAAFFRRVRAGQTPGYPRFKSAARWKQLEFPHGDRALKLDAAQTKVRIPGVGTVRLRKGRAVPAFGRAFVVEKNGRWYAVFECQREPEPLASTGKTIGVDRGVHVLAASSEGVLIANGAFAEGHRRIVVGHQRNLDAASVKDRRGRCLSQERVEPRPAGRGIWNSSPFDRRESCECCSSGDRGRSELFVADVRALPARCGGESPEKAFLLRVVWLEQPRRRCGGAGDPAPGRVAAHERGIVGEHPAHLAGCGVRTRTTISGHQAHQVFRRRQGDVTPGAALRRV